MLPRLLSLARFRGSPRKETRKGKIKEYVRREEKRGKGRMGKLL